MTRPHRLPLLMGTPGGGTGTAASGAPTDAQYVVLTLDGTLSAERKLTCGSHIWFNDGGANGNVTIDRRPYRSYTIIEEEFLGGTGTSGAIGALGIGFLSGSFAGKAGETSHPGMITQTANNVVSRALVGSANTATGDFNDIAYAGLVCRPLSGTATMSFRFGLIVTPATSGEGSQGIYWSYLPGSSANWSSVSVDGSGTTRNATSTAYATATWFFLEIFRAESGVWDFFLNGAFAFRHTTNLPGPAPIGFIALVLESNEAVNKTIDHDWLGIGTINPLGQRWT